MSSGANDQARILQFAAFRDHGLARVTMYPIWPNIVKAKLFQPSHNGFIPTAKELSEIF